MEMAEIDLEKASTADFFLSLNLNSHFKSFSTHFICSDFIFILKLFLIEKADSHREGEAERKVFCPPIHFLSGYNGRS